MKNKTIRLINLKANLMRYQMVILKIFNRILTNSLKEYIELKIIKRNSILMKARKDNTIH